MIKNDSRFSHGDVQDNGWLTGIEFLATRQKRAAGFLERGIDWAG
jgi:hypothetical protein